MKKLSYLLSLLLLMTMTVFTSCKDDEDGPVLKTPAQEAAEKLIGTYTVTSATRDDVAVDLEGQTVTLTFNAEEDGTGGTFTSNNAGVLPGDTDLPASGTWAWSGANFNAVVVGGKTLNFTTPLGASPTTFTYTGTDAKGNFTARVTATKAN